ncbi:MAG: SdiA-regulated domain-containing protein [Pseudomonadota bacterium]
MHTISCNVEGVPPTLRNAKQGRLNAVRLIGLCLVLSDWVCATSTHAQTVNLPTTLLGIKQLDSEYRQDYGGRQAVNLSGLTEIDGRVYGLGDKPADQCLYALSERDNLWRIDGRVELAMRGRADLEGVFSHQREFYVVNESGQDVYRYRLQGAKAEKLSLDVAFPWSSATTLWRNAGLEGVAVDARQGILYLAKERDPSKIFVFRLDASGNANFQKEFSVEPASDAHPHQSVSDLYFENGFLYVLERRAYSIAKVDPRQERVVARAGYSYLRDASGDLFEGDNGYGLAEALLLRNSEILLGLDNNGKPINERNRLSRQYSLRGDEPAIVRISRPEGF